MTLTVSKRLILSLSFALIALLFTNAYSLWALYQSQGRFTRMDTEVRASLVDVAAMQNTLLALRLYATRHALAPTAELKDREEKTLTALADKMNLLIEKYQREDVQGDPGNQRLADRDRDNYREYQKVASRVGAVAPTPESPDTWETF